MSYEAIESHNDMKWGVFQGGDLIALFADKDLAEDFAGAILNPEDDIEVLDKDDGFYIDYHNNITSRISR